MNRIIILYFLLMFLIGTDTFLISPLLPVLRETYGISVASSGWMIGAYALGYALFALVIGPLSDGWNRKKVMLYGMIGFAVSTFLCGIAPNFAVMLLFRALSGISAAVVTPQVWASIPSVVRSHQILRAMGMVTGGLAISQTLGVPVGAFMAARTWSLPFFLLGASALLLAVLIRFLVPDLPPGQVNRQASGLRFLQSYRSVLTAKNGKISFIAYFAFQLGNFAAFSFLGTWLADAYSLDVAQTGQVMMFLGLGNLLGSLFGSQAVKRFGKRGVLVFALGAAGALYLGISVSPSPFFVKAGLFAIFLLMGTLFPVMMAELQSLSHQARGTIAALSNAVMYGATTAGSYIAGVLYGWTGQFMAVASLTLACFVLSLGLWLKIGSREAPAQQNAARGHLREN
ncbi:MULTISPECIES: MFS transporter [Paenibacillus]|uniref:MFS transporter n=1 Tax=Paenibacillus TaxID=44249 RepID=UPI002FE0C13E